MGGGVGHEEQERPVEVDVRQATCCGSAPRPDCKTGRMSDGVDIADRRTLERLALAEYSEAAAARVISITVRGKRAEVALLVNGDYEYWEYFQRDQQGWHETSSSSGPFVDWDDSTAR